LKKNGVIVGAFMDEEFSVYHILTKEPSVRDKMRGSKYVQSNVNEAYREIKKNLENGVFVMFVGTPCQAHALRLYLKKDYDTLFVVDILCHGIPSNKMFKEHISYISSLGKCGIKEYHFRTKRYGRRNSIQEYKLDNGNKFITSFEAQEYASFFRQSLSIRPSCRTCRYRCTHRFGDLTIGDYWGDAEPLKSGIAGVSLVCVNTPRGQSLIDSADNIKYINVNTKEITRRPEFNTPRYVNQKRYDEFWNNYRELGYSKIVPKYYHVTFLQKLRFQIKIIIAKMTR
jgi:coenzyme F420-reducing hydrogenase beta subunit